MQKKKFVFNVHLLHLLHEMNTEYRYILDKKSRKHHCPDCNRKTFVCYIDTVTGNYLPEQFGRCDRESKCNYHLNPYKNGYSKMIWEQENGNRSEIPNNWKPQQKKAIAQPTNEPIFFDFEIFKQTLSNYEHNIFIQNLLQNISFPFEIASIEKIISLFRLGTISNGYRKGAITFPFIDINDNVRAIQVKQFDNDNHTTGTDFLHSIIEKHHTRNNKPLPEWLEAYTKQDKRITCLFGEHLLSKYPNNPIALVEAPKTAIYGTLYFGLPETPESLIWLAVYNKSSFSYEKMKVLEGRFVYVFPDLSKDGNTFKEWKTKAKEYESRLNGTRFIFSDLLEQLAPERDKNDGNDLADYLIKQDWRLFRKQNIQEQPQPETEKSEASEVSEAPKQTFISQPEPLPKVEVIKEIEFSETIKKEQPENWNNDISELETFFNTMATSNQPIQLNAASRIIDLSIFVTNHLATVKTNNGNKRFLPYLNRLQKIKIILTNI
jgi:hypothetical protein